MKSEHTGIKIWRVLYPAGLYFVIGWIVSIVGFEIIKAISSTDNIEGLYYRNAALLTGIAAAVSIPIFYLLFAKDQKENPDRGREGAENSSVKEWFLIILVSFFAGNALDNMISMTGIADVFKGWNQVQEALYGGGIWVEVIGLCILVPIAEELLYRGLIYNRIKSYTNKAAALIVTSLAFAFYHGNVVQGIFAFGLSLLIIGIYEKKQRIIVPIVMHITVNTSSVLASELNLFSGMYKSTVTYLIGTGVFIAGGIVCWILINKENN